MPHKDVVDLANRFRSLEIHAARGGREVLQTLINVAATSNGETIDALTQELRDNIVVLLQSLPPYAPPLNNINHILLSIERAERMHSSIQNFNEELAELGKGVSSLEVNIEKIVNNIDPMIIPGSTIYTHTLSETVLLCLFELFKRGKVGRVYVTESRPNNDGLLTAIKLANSGFEVQLTIDAAVPNVIEKSNLMVSGAEIITHEGDVIGKVGTYTAAVFCRLTKIPVFILADTSKVSPLDQSCFHFTPLLPQDLGISSGLTNQNVVGSYFDLTPASYIHSYITEKGVMTTSNIGSTIKGKTVSRWLIDQLHNHSHQPTTDIDERIKQ
jgi:translation initiation factor 2B subunit (eIF-2B alpha/beta/delta family)